MVVAILTPLTFLRRLHSLRFTSYIGTSLSLCHSLDRIAEQLHSARCSGRLDTRRRLQMLQPNRHATCRSSRRLPLLFRARIQSAGLHLRLQCVPPCLM